MNATLEFFHMYAEQIHWQVGEMRTSQAVFPGGWQREKEEIMLSF